MQPAVLETALGEVHNFAELVAALYAARHTGVVHLHFLGGVPQQAELGRPHVVVFAKPGPAHTAAVDKPLDSARPAAPSSTA